MRPIAEKTNDFETRALSSHEKKIQKRVVAFMQIVEGLAFSPTGKLTVLKFLLDKTAVVLSKAKDAEKFNDKFHHFTEELDLAVRKSKKEENRQEFLNLLQDRLARDGLGKNYREYAALKGSGTSTADLIAWISEKQKVINPPKVKQRSHSQPAMFVSAPTPAPPARITTAAPAANLPSSAPAVIVLPTVAQPAMQPLYPNMIQQPVAYPAVQYPFAPPTPQQYFPYPASPNPGHYPPTPPNMGHHQPFPASGMANPQYPFAPPTHQQYLPYPPTPNPGAYQAANAQPQPQTSSLTGSAPVPVTFNTSGMLNPKQEQSRDEVINSCVNANFNRNETITLLKFLVNNELPNYSEKPEAKRFNDKLNNFINFYEKIRVSTGEQRHTRWTFECACRIAVTRLNSPERVMLMDKFLEENTESIANWLNTLYDN